MPTATALGRVPLAWITPQTKTTSRHALSIFDCPSAQLPPSPRRQEQTSTRAVTTGSSRYVPLKAASLPSCPRPKVLDRRGLCLRSLPQHQHTIPEHHSLFSSIHLAASSIHLLTTLRSLAFESLVLTSSIIEWLDRFLVVKHHSDSARPLAKVPFGGEFTRHFASFA